MSALIDFIWFAVNELFLSKSENFNEMKGDYGKHIEGLRGKSTEELKHISRNGSPMEQRMAAGKLLKDRMGGS